MFKSKTFRKMLISITLVCFCFYGIRSLQQPIQPQGAGKIQGYSGFKVRFWEEQLEQGSDKPSAHQKQPDG